MSYELELLVLAVVLYLYDSTVLLSVNESILSYGGRSGWQVHSGRDGILISGRRVCLLNPLTPFRPCVRLRWNLYAPAPLESDESWSSELPRLAIAAPWILAAALALFVFLPIGLFTSLGILAILPAAGIVYVSILAALLVLRWTGRLGGLSRMRFALLLFECLACPPFGINAIRRIALTRQVKESLLNAGARLLPAAGWNALREHCIGILDLELAALDESSEERIQIEQQREHLRGLEQTR